MRPNRLQTIEQNVDLQKNSKTQCDNGIGKTETRKIIGDFHGDYIYIR